MLLKRARCRSTNLRARWREIALWFGMLIPSGAHTFRQSCLKRREWIGDGLACHQVGHSGRLQPALAATLGIVLQVAWCTDDTLEPFSKRFDQIAPAGRVQSDSSHSLGLNGTDEGGVDIGRLDSWSGTGPTPDDIAVRLEQS